MQARAIPVRTPRRRRARPWRRTPLAALLLSMLAFTSPALTVAPLNASEPGARARPDVARDREAPAPRRPQLIEELVRPVAFPPAPPAPPVVDRSVAGPSFAAALHAARAHGGAYGVAFAAVRDGSVIWAGASGRARDGRTELSATTPLVIGSVTKTFIAATVLQLVDEGRVRLDDPLRRHLPQLRQLSDEITVAQLLDHTSGLADLFNDTTRRGLEEEPTRSWVAADVLATLHEPWYEPGEGWAYANTNYFLLAMLVEAVTGEPLAAELDARFLDPLNLGTTSVLDGGEPGSPLDEAWTTIFWGSGAMGASAGDLARWGDALYAGDLLSRESR
ncbi:MAG TPA: serine hydrolase domain-containing protein, partial [Patescibacteria group bacterium]|nr:serine hydrolase domain-containing protein [Patescibacteria group bacterium]